MVAFSVQHYKVKDVGHQSKQRALHSPFMQIF